MHGAFALCKSSSQCSTCSQLSQQTFEAIVFITPILQIRKLRQGTLRNLREVTGKCTEWSQNKDLLTFVILILIVMLLNSANTIFFLLDRIYLYLVKKKRFGGEKLKSERKCTFSTLQSSISETWERTPFPTPYDTKTEFSSIPEIHFSRF